MSQLPRVACLRETCFGLRYYRYLSASVRNTAHSVNLTSIWSGQNIVLEEAWSILGSKLRSYEEENVYIESKFSIRPIDQKKTFKRISIDSFHRLASETIEIREINEHRYLYTSRIRASIGLSSRMTGGYRPVDEFPLI